MATLEIDINEREVEKAIVDAFRTQINSVLSKAATHIKARVRQEIYSRITEAPEYKSLVNHGQLQGELGVPNPGSSMAAILNIWIKSIQITLRPAKKTGNDIRAFLDIDMINGSFSDVLNLEEAKYYTEKGQEIPWLEWLLTFGDSIIVRNYDIVFNAKYSRTGLNIMLKDISSNWRIPPEFSGTINNNFVTRALEGIDGFLNETVEQEITRVL